MTPTQPPYSAPPPVDRGRRVSHSLLFVAILQFIMGPIATLIASHRANQPIPPQTSAILWAGAAALFALAAIARRKPLPAAVASLGLFIAIYAVDAAIGRIPITQGLIFKVIILIVLLRAIRTAQPPLT